MPACFHWREKDAHATMGALIMKRFCNRDSKPFTRADVAETPGSYHGREYQRTRDAKKPLMQLVEHVTRETGMGD